VSVQETAAPAADRVRVEVSAHVAEIALARPAKHNALDRAMFDALSAAIDDIAADTAIRAVVLHGEGPSFCSGLDFPSFIAAGTSTEVLFARREGEPANLAQRITYGWRALPVPVLAAIHGACFGGGLQIALAADLRIGAPDARMSVMEIDYGLIPDMGISQSLPALVRDDVARELVYTGRIVAAEEAAVIGLLTRLDDDPVAAARALAGEIAARSPDATRAAKRLIDEGFGTSPETSLGLEEELQRSLIGSPNQIAAATAKLSGEPASFENPAATARPD
jgi:enoyl-CoA hydratase/carnithine racemase